MTARLTGSAASTNPLDVDPGELGVPAQGGAQRAGAQPGHQRHRAPSRPAATATFRALPPGRATYCGAVPSGPAPASGTGSRSTTSSPRTHSFGMGADTGPP